MEHNNHNANKPNMNTTQQPMNTNNQGRYQQRGFQKRGGPNDQAMKRPNFFLALRLHNCKETAREIHKTLCEYDGYDDKRLNTFRDKMHITIFVLRLNTSEDIQKIVDALSSAKELYSKYWGEAVNMTNKASDTTPEATTTSSKFTMRVKGLGHFGDPTTKRFVLWSGLEDSTDEGKALSAHLTKFVRELHAHISALHPTLLTESADRFTPHATLYKTKFEKKRFNDARKYSRKPFDNAALNALKLKFAEFELANQPIVDIQLLEMQRVDPDGFYRCFAKQSLTGPFAMNWIIKNAPRLDREWREYQAQLKGELVPAPTPEELADEENGAEELDE